MFVPQSGGLFPGIADMSWPVLEKLKVQYTSEKGQEEMSITSAVQIVGLYFLLNMDKAEFNKMLVAAGMSKGNITKYGYAEEIESRSFNTEFRFLQRP